MAVLYLGISTGVLAQEKQPDFPAKLLSAVPYEISAEDEAAGIEGTMKLVADISAKGDVTDATLFVGPSWPCSVDLYQRVNSVMRNAEKAVLGYKFSPAIENGKPTYSSVVIPIPIGKAARKVDANTSTTFTAVSGGVKNGKSILLPKPTYPRDAKDAHISGAVTVQIFIGEDGNIISAQAVGGSPVFHFAAREAACRAKYTPTTLNGVPVKVMASITYNFAP